MFEEELRVLVGEVRAKEHLSRSPSSPSQQEIYASNWHPRVVFEENEGKNGL